LHESQVPALHKPSQQTVSTQWLVVHWLSRLHVWPRVSFGTQTPAEQYCVAEHWLSFMQPPHWLPLQVPGAQLWVCATGHVADPAQFCASVAVEPVQLGGLHW
jgi:hypothetical protein